MSKLSTRIALAVIISLVIVAGVYFSVQALSTTSVHQNLGTYVLNGSLVNPLQVQTVEEASQPELKTYPAPDSEGRGCDHEGDTSSDF